MSPVTATARALGVVMESATAVRLGNSPYLAGASSEMSWTARSAPSAIRARPMMWPNPRPEPETKATCPSSGPRDSEDSTASVANASFILLPLVSFDFSQRLVRGSVGVRRRDASSFQRMARVAIRVLVARPQVRDHSVLGRHFGSPQGHVQQFPMVMKPPLLGLDAGVLQRLVGEQNGSQRIQRLDQIGIARRAPNFPVEGQIQRR